MGKGRVIMGNIAPCLWFNDQAEEAARFYTSVFNGGKIKHITHYGADAADASGQPEGSVMTVVIEVEGQDIMLLNGGPAFQFTHAISLMVECDTQEKIDRLWDALSAGGSVEQCGWLKDKYGVSWQIVPSIINQVMKGADQAKVNRVMKAVLGMVKLDIETIKKAA